MWEISLYMRGRRVVRTFDDQDEVGVANLWWQIKRFTSTRCRRIRHDEVEGTWQPGDPIHRPGAWRIRCNDCEKDAWSRDPNQVICIGCEVTTCPNEPPAPRGQECTLSDSGYHEWRAPDAAGVRRCRQCCKRDDRETY